MKTELSANFACRFALAFGLAAVACPNLALARESSAATGQSAAAVQEEWYDPSDWYDAEYSVSEGHTDSDYYDESWDDVDWQQDFDQVFNDDFGVDYSWNVDEGAWQLVYDDDFDFDGSAKHVFGNDALDEPAAIGPPDEEASILDLSEAGPANDEEGGQSVGSNGTRSALQNEEGREGVEILTGTVADFRNIDVGYATGARQTHALARIELEGGGRAVVDLGLADLWENDLSSGDKVIFHGAKGVANGKSVFVATRVTAKGETAFVNRVIPQRHRAVVDEKSREASSSAGQSAQTMTIEGQIADTAKVKIEGEDRTLLKVRMQSGRFETVSLGSSPSVAELGLREGDRLRVEGELKRIDGKNVVAATSLSVEGENVEG